MDDKVILQALEQIAASQERLEDVIRGNGQEGLVTKVAVLQDRLKLFLWSFAIAAGTLITLVVNELWAVLQN